MKWKGIGESDNVEDRRGMSGGGKAVVGGGAIAIVFFLLKMFMPDSAPLLDKFKTKCNKVKQRQLQLEKQPN